jgi:membrane protease YdiL (CAAX protease family)
MLAWWLSQGRRWSGLGLGVHVTPGLIGILLGLAVMIVLVLRQRRQALHDEQALEQVRGQLARLALLLPTTPRELSWFYALSVTAGLCEELLYRGYMIWYLAHFMGLIPAIGVAALVFGLAHAYQGPRGIAMTAGVGLFLGAAYLVSGSLYAGMLAHALMDLHSGHLGYVALTRAPELGRDDAPESMPGWEKDDEMPEPGDVSSGPVGSVEPR